MKKLKICDIMREKRDIKKMPSDSNKKLLILYILKILQEYSDEKHPLTYSEIISKIFNNYGMTVERKSIGANIQSLIDFGYEIENIPRKGWYLAERLFEDGEITFLIDSVFSSSSISGKYSIELADKISTLLSKHKRKKYKYIYKAKEINRPDSKQLFYIIDILTEAIEKKKKVCFNYIKYTKDKKIVNRRDDYVYTVSPYFMINNKGKYFLACNLEKYDNLSNFKIDKIVNISISNEPARPIKEISAYATGFDIAKYVNENLYMFGDKNVNAVVKIAHEWNIDIVVEWFGDDVQLEEKDGEFFAKINVNQSSLIVWALQYAESIEIISPVETRERMKEILENTYKKYNGYGVIYENSNKP